MFNKKRISLLPVGVVSVIAKYINHHSSCSTCIICDNNQNESMNGNQQDITLSELMSLWLFSKSVVHVKISSLFPNTKKVLSLKFEKSIIYISHWNLIFSPRFVRSVMYFSKTPYRQWSLNRAFHAYAIHYQDADQAVIAMKNDLNLIACSPNQQKAARDAAQKLLNKFDLYISESKFYRVLKERSSSSETDQDEPQPQQQQQQQQQQPQGSIILNQNDHNINNITLVFESQLGKRRRANDIPDEVDQFFNNGESSRTQQGPSIVFLKGANGVRVVPTTNYYIVKDVDDTHSFNATVKFQELQRYAINIANNTGFILETNVELLLSLSSILLIKPGQYSDDVLKFFNGDELDSIHNDVLIRLAGDKYDEIKMDRNLKSNVEDIIDKLLQRKGDRTVAISELAKLIPTLNQHEAKLILALMSLIQKLPPYPLISPLGEMELCCQYLDPILFSMFNDYSSNVNFRWPNLTLHDEAAQSNQSSRRPDATMTMITQNRFGENRGCGEVKTSQNSSNYDLTRDLVRINTFSKQAIDSAEMQAVMGFQAVGNHVTFSALVLANDSVYVACDIAAMDFPRALPDLQTFLPMLDKLLLVLHVYDQCIPNTAHNFPVEWKRESLDSPDFKHYVHTI